MGLKRLITGGLLPIAMGVLAVNTTIAQTVFEGADASAIVAQAEIIRASNYSELPSYIKLGEGSNIKSSEAITWLTEELEINFQFGFELIREEEDELGFVHYRYGQTHNGYPLEHTHWFVHTKDGVVKSMNGFIHGTPVNATAPTLSENEALEYALDYVDAEVYKWELAGEEEHLKWEQEDQSATYFPVGEVVYAPAGTAYEALSYRLAYKFNIYAHDPVGRSEIYVDAATGTILFENKVIHHADVPGTAETQYSGPQTITADSFGGSYRLRETGRGIGVRTFDMNEGTSYGGSVDFTDADNYWNNVNADQDEYATDAHYGAEMTYDYYWLQHGRNSIDGAGFRLDSYIHYDVNYSNAFWDGTRMTYGDGGGGYNPFVAMDIAGHEITHGLTTFTANLQYQDESGALNESFSDIFGTCIEEYAQPTWDWNVGEDIGAILRSMSNPNAYGDPDTYFGTNWAPLGGPDNGGVHTNSGVQNYWFYLLTTGGTGTNDNGDAYNVTGLGIDDAASIAFRNLTVYLGNNSSFSDARFYAIQSAVDLFGGCTPEVEATTNAWYAVGVGAEYDPSVTAAFNPNSLGGCVNPLTVDFANSSNNGISFEWDFGDGGTSTAVNPSHTYTTNGIYTVTLIADGGLCGIDTLVVTDQIFIGQLPDPVVNDGSRCDPGTVDLSASAAGQIDWYDVPSGGTPVGTGSSFTTPSLSATTTYYVESQTGLSPEYVGPVDNTFGGGGYFTGDQWLVFDCMRPVTLKSVWVDANGGGNRTVELRDNTGSVIQSATINIPNGQSRIILNFSIPVGTDLQLGCTIGSSPDLYRNNSGPSYPYTIPGLVSITESSAGTPGYYYFFYDWELQEAPCSSARVPVTAGIAAAPTTVDDDRCGSGVVNLSASGAGGTLKWYDAPSGGTLVNTGTNYSVLLSTTTTYYVEEEILPPADYVGPSDNTFGTGGFFSGDQHLLFDVATACTLKSVKVYAGSGGNRDIELRNSVGTVIQSTTVNIPAGESRVTLNFPLTPGTDYELGWAPGSSPDLYRNNSSPTYPYDLAGVVTITNSSAGVDYYYCYYDWEIQQTGCITARIPVTGTINSSYDATITPVGPLCVSDGPVTMTAVDGGGTWSGTGMTGSDFDPATAGPGTHTISYDITGACGDSDTYDITVSAAFDATITSPGAFCEGDAALNLSAADGGGTWSGTGITDGVNGTFDPATAGAGTHTITYTIAGSCGDTDTEDITVMANTDATITPVGPFCELDAAVTMTAVDGGGTWSGTGMTGADFDPAAAGPGTHTITYDITGACGDSDTYNIVVDPVADATITPVGPFCELDAPVTMTAVDGGGTWSGTGMTGASFDPAAAGVGTHTITYDITGACSDSDTYDIVVDPQADASITSAGPFCDDDGIQIITSAEAGGTWTADCGSCIDPVTGAFDPTVGAGTYTITYTITGACGDIDNITVTVNLCSGVVENNAGFGFELYPNPAETGVQLEINSSVSRKVTIDMLNALGQLVWAKQVTLNGVTIQQINLNDVERGVYFIRVSDGVDATTQKLIVR